MTLRDLNDRSLEIFKELVETYVEHGEAIGSVTLSQRLTQKLSSKLSPATIRNIMSDLEKQGLLYSPHTSAGRIPTEKGLRLFVDALLENPEFEAEEIASFEAQCGSKSLNTIMEKASTILSGVSRCASIVIAPKLQHALIKHIEFVPVNPYQGLVILVAEDGMVENRLIDLPPNITLSQLTEASNYINYQLQGLSLTEIKNTIEQQWQSNQLNLDTLVQKTIEKGLAVWDDNEQSLIVTGQSHLLSNIHDMADLDKIKTLFGELETKESINQLLEASIQGDGIKIFIGSEHRLFEKSGCSMIARSYQNHKAQTIGFIGVIGPMHMNYRRLIPMVNYSAKLISKLIRS